MTHLNTKNQILLVFTVFLISLSCFSQTGVNTKNPLHILHVDGKNDNPASAAPNPTQQLNDFVVTQNGDVGIGTISPTVKLDVNGKIKVSDIPLLETKPKKVLVMDEEGNIFYSDIETIAPPVDTRIYAIINKDARQRLPLRNTYYNLLLDGTISGVNSNKINVSSDKTTLILPANKTLKISGSIGIIGATEAPTTTNAAYIVSNFDLEDINNGGSQTLVKTIGYTESSTERYDDGGVSVPIIIVRTGTSGANVHLKVKYSGSDSPPNGYYVGGAPGESTLGSYILIEEI